MLQEWFPTNTPRNGRGENSIFYGPCAESKMGKVLVLKQLPEKLKPFNSKVKEIYSKFDKRIVFGVVTLLYLILAFLMILAFKGRIVTAYTKNNPDFTNFHLAYFATYAFLVMGYALGAALWFTLFKRKYPVEKVFVVIAALIGLMYTFVVPPFGVPDEQSHYLKAYSLSESHIFSQSDAIGDFVSVKNGDAELYNTMAPYNQNYVHEMNNIDFSISGYQCVRYFLKKAPAADDQDYTRLDYFSQMNAYSPLAYVAPALGISIGELIHLKPILIFYLARLMNLALFILLLYFALKLMPFGKMILFGVAMLPMTMHQAASLSADCVVNAVSFFFIAYCLYAAYKLEKIRFRDVAALLVSAIVIANIKYAYFPLFLLIFIIPRSKFRNLKTYLISMATVAVPAVASWGIWALKTKKYYAVGNTTLTAAQISANTHYIFAHFPAYIHLALHTMTQAFQDYVMMMIGQRLLWLNIQINYSLVICFILLIVFAAFVGYESDPKITKSTRILSIVASVLIMGLVMTSMFVTWTPKSLDVIQGVQGRYLLPFLPLILLLGRNRFVISKKAYEKPMIIAFTVLQFLALYNVYGNICKIFNTYVTFR